MKDPYETMYALRRKGKYSQAKRWLKNRIRQNEPHFYDWLEMADIERRMKHYEAAEDSLAKAKSLGAPTEILAYNQGLIALNQKYYTASAREWDKILEMGEACWIYRDALMYKAECQYKIGYNKEAEALARQHLLLRKRGVASDFTKSEVQRFIRRIERLRPKGEFDFGPMMDREVRRKTHDIYMQLRKRKDPSAYKQYLEDLSKTYSGEYYIWILLSKVYRRTGQYPESLKAAETAVRICPTDHLCVITYAEALRANGCYAEAIPQYDLILRRHLKTIAYDAHGEGMRYAERMKRKARRGKALCTKALKGETRTTTSRIGRRD